MTEPSEKQLEDVAGRVTPNDMELVIGPKEVYCLMFALLIHPTVLNISHWVKFYMPTLQNLTAAGNFYLFNQLHKNTKNHPIPGTISRSKY